MIPAALMAFIGRVPWLAWAVAGVVVAVLVWNRVEVKRAVEAFSAGLTRESEKQGSEADKAERLLLECAAKGGRWNRVEFKCE